MAPMSEFDDERARLLREIARETRLTARLTGRATLSEAVLAALAAVPREDFVGPFDRAAAYANRPLQIGHGQTISQPFIVTLMTELIDPGPEDTVLEIGTGSGYQAAALATIVKHVYSIERVRELAAAAAERLHALGYSNVTVRRADGAKGWVEHAPFDGIVVTAAAAEVPPALMMQLKRGGRMVIPVGRPNAEQTLTVVAKDAHGAVAQEAVLAVAFVPLIGEDA